MFEQIWETETTSPRIVTSQQHRRSYVDEVHCTVNIFIHKQPTLYLTVPVWSSESSRRLFHEGNKRPREQYLGSLKRTLKQNREI